MKRRNESGNGQAVYRRPAYASRGEGFTLIELLTVISIIALIAGMVIGLAPVASRTMKLKRVEADLHQLVTAIESYHAKYKVYPPDNIDSSRNVIPSLNSLFYELCGTVYNTNRNSFMSLQVQEEISITAIQSAFNTRGFINYSESPTEVKNFLPNWKSSLIGRITNSNPKYEVNVLTVPVRGTNALALNPWRYVSSKPTNNSTSFDLWAEIVIGKQTNIIGNWKE